MKKALLLFAALLVAGCGENESVAETIPTEAVSVSAPFKYETEGNAVTITGCDRKASGALIIPAAIEGKPVTSIGKWAFYECISLTSITFGTNSKLTSVGAKAFARCMYLKSITIPDGVTSIGSFAFGQCTSLTSITIPNGVTSISSGAFFQCSSRLTNITIPDSVTSIESWAFKSCSSLTSITIPDGVTNIGGEAFAYCTSLTAVTFLGDAPKDGGRVFDEAAPTIYRNPKAKGWGETFDGRPVKLISEKP